MATTFSLERVRHLLIPTVAGLIGLGVAVGIATVPSDVLNAAVDRGGFASILPAAASPIGATGRTLIALLAGALIAACGFVPQLKAMLVERVEAFARRPRRDEGAEAEDVPVVRRADAHPDAPPRRPIRAASDLGDPLPIFGEEDRRSAPLPPPVVQSLPDDLDRPLADFDPAAVPLRPMAPPEPVAPLIRAADQPAPVDAPMPRFAWLAPDEASEEPDFAPSVEHITVDESAVESIGVAPASPGVEQSVSHRPIEVAPTPAHGPVSEPAPSDEVTPPRVIPQSMPVEPAPLPIHAPAPAPTLIAASTPPQAPPVAAAAPATAASPANPTNPDDSIAGLLARLERGAAQRRVVATPVTTSPIAPASVPIPPAPEPQSEPVSLDETLQRLRRLAAG